MPKEFSFDLNKNTNDNVKKNINVIICIKPVLKTSCNQIRIFDFILMTK